MIAYGIACEAAGHLVPPLRYQQRLHRRDGAGSSSSSEGGQAGKQHKHNI